MSQSSLTGLHLACRDGDLEGVRVRLTDATSLELTAGESQGTPLHFACVGGSLEIVRLLLRHQADVHSRDLFHWVPLHASSRYGHEEVVGELLAAGAAVDSKDRWEWTPLHHAAREGHTAVLQQLLGAGADTEARTSELWTPLHLAARYGHLEACRTLCARGGAAVEAANNGRRTALNLACFGGHPAVAQFLLDEGADPNAMAESGTMPGDEFHESVAEDQKGAILEILNSNERTADRANMSTASNAGQSEGGGSQAVRMLQELQTTNEDLERQLQEANRVVEKLTNAVGELSTQLSDQKKKEVASGTAPKDICEICTVC